MDKQVKPTLIFITGCARSGTTLLRRLFHCFKDVEVIPNEIRARELVEIGAESKAQAVVAKRWCGSIFSNKVSGEQWGEDVKMIL